MLDYLIEANNLRGEFVVAGLIKNPSDEKDVDVSPYIELIKKLINPKIEYNDGKKTNWPYSELVEERKSFLFEVRTSLYLYYSVYVRLQFYIDCGQQEE